MEKSRRLFALDGEREQLSIRGDMVRCPESEANTEKDQSATETRKRPLK